MTNIKGYDYIIVGGGSAGCVLAARLSEDPAIQVLLLEAGGSDRNLLFHIPAGFAKMTRGIASWGYSTVPQCHMQNRVFWYTQAKVIGGGSSINAQLYNRGNALDFNEWRQLGNEGWSYQDVLPYFKKAENFERGADEYHGIGGPLAVSDPRGSLPICEAFFAAGEELGIPRNFDVNGASQDGLGYYQMTQKNVTRASTSKAYLNPSRRRRNLTVRQNVQVAQLTIEGQRVRGVKLLNNESLSAAREVVLCSGAIGSPKLLMQSGIGPADHLGAVGIKTLHDLPGVGGNLQDHVDLFVISECTGDHTYDKYGRPFWAALAGLRYFLTKSGPAANALFSQGGFWYADENARSADTQFHLGLGSGIEAGVAKLKHAGVTLNSAFMRPRSRGSVRLASSDPTEMPLIDPNYWADPFDKEMSIRGLKLARDILNQKALKPYVMAERLPGASLKTDAQLADYACKHAKTDHHPVGTCKMGHDKMAVVSPRLKLHGLEGLRIADASVMPTITTGNTNAPTIMIAEKAADLIIRG